MVSFNDTKIAFESKNTADLKRSYHLFKVIGNPSIVKLGGLFTPIALKLHLPIKGIIKKTIYRQFVGGETITDCEKTIETLSNYHIGTILDYSVEGKEGEKDFDHCMEETLRGIERAKNDPRIPFCVFKPTGLARRDLLAKVSSNTTLSDSEIEEWKRAQNRVRTICESSHLAEKPIFIDAEESWIQNAIDQLAYQNMKLFNKNKCIVYNTFQLYRHDRLQFLNDCILQSKSDAIYFGAKLVRGAYMEKERKRATETNYPSPIQPDKKCTDNHYNQALETCLSNENVFLCAGTHNEQSSQMLIELLGKFKIPPSNPRVYFSQLLGMSDHISFNLSKSGYNVAKYVPYGPVNEVLPYLLRRAAENTSVKGQTGRELNLIMMEQQRRKTR